MITLAAVPIKLVNVPPNPTGELAEHVLRVCNFCAKNVELFGQEINEKLSGQDAFYCSFCLRHGHNTRNNQHVLPMSFRAVLGYYYYEFHHGPANQRRYKKMWLSEIIDYLDSHRKTGLQNPVFSYDDEAMMWFVDFAKVGSSKKKISVEEVLKTVVNILVCFNLPENVPSVRAAKFFGKFKEAILNFHSRRYRPDGRRHLIPTLANCVGYGADTKLLEKTRHFSPALLTDF